jgi:hypothetical protein
LRAADSKSFSTTTRKETSMGAIAEAIVGYAQPLIDQTDGSHEQMEKALAISQVCWNLALLPKEKQEESLREMQPSLGMDDDEFDEFRSTVLVPMIQRHEEMFPRLHGHHPTASWPSGPSRRAHAETAASAEKYPGTDRYAPCPCNSGRKYKFCCGAREEWHLVLWQVLCRK